MNVLDLTGQHSLITGGCGAIGRVVIRMLAEQGATVAVNDVLPANEAHQLLADAGAQSPGVFYYQADVTQPEEVARLCQEGEEHSSLPTIVCWHARMTETHPIQRYPL